MSRSGRSPRRAVLRQQNECLAGILGGVGRFVAWLAAKTYRGAGPRDVLRRAGSAARGWRGFDAAPVRCGRPRRSPGTFRLRTPMPPARQPRLAKPEPPPRSQSEWDARAALLGDGQLPSSSL